MQAGRLGRRAALENLCEHMPLHLWGRLNPVNVQYRGGDIEGRRHPTDELMVLLDARSHGNERSRHVVGVGVIVLGDHGSCGWGEAVTHVSVCIAELAERLDAVV